MRLGLVRGCGLASKFRNLTLTGKVEYDRFDPVRLALTGEVTKNIAFDRGRIDPIAVNNRGSSPGEFKGGDLAWNLANQLGPLRRERRRR